MANSDRKRKNLEYLTGKRYIIGIDPCSTHMDCVIIDRNGLQVGKAFKCTYDWKGFNDTFFKKVMMWKDIISSFKNNNPMSVDELIYRTQKNRKEHNKYINSDKIHRFKKKRGVDYTLKDIQNSFMLKAVFF